jgi:hypothetical protein
MFENTNANLIDTEPQKIVDTALARKEVDPIVM